MAVPTLSPWISYWLVVATILVSIDCIYVLGIAFGLSKYVPNVVLSLWGWYGETDSQYSAAGIQDSNGWIVTQSIFNVFEVIMQLVYVFGLKKNSTGAHVLLLLVSMGTFWKTLIYMCIIATCSDPVHMVPGLACFGFEPLEVNRAHVQKALETDGCAVQWFKFQFNFWWILMPLLAILSAWRNVNRVFNIGSKANKDK